MGYENARKKSRMAFHAAMIELMRAKPVHSITVTELCAMCRLNRSTFYAHYATMDDLIDDLHSDLFREIERYLHISPETSGAQDEALFTRFLVHVCQEDERFSLFLRSDRKNLFVTNMVAYFLARLCPWDAAPAQKNFKLYHIVGSFTLICTWIQDGFPCPAQELAAQVLALASGARKA